MLYKYVVFFICAGGTTAVMSDIVADGEHSSPPDFVGFSVSMDEFKNITNCQTVKYPNVITNAGNHYDLNTGMFTAPMTAYFMFHIHAMSLTGFGFQLIHNEIPRISLPGTTTKAKMATPNAWNMAGNSVLLKLKVRERVYVNTNAPSNVFGDGTKLYTTFTGYLVGQ